MKKISTLFFIFAAVTASAFAGETKRKVASMEKPIEVSHLIKCHEGKFDAMNAVSQLTYDVSKDAVYGWSGIGGYPDGKMEGDLVTIKAPFNVSAPTFVQVKDVTWACVTVSKQ